MAGVGADVDALQFNRAVAKLYELVNAVEKAKPSASRHTAVDTIVRLVAPMMPHLAEEAWARLGREGLVADAPWPEADPALLVDDSVTIAIQVKIGRASCRERACKYVEISVVAVALKKNHLHTTNQENKKL